MTEAELKNLLTQMEAELNGDPDHDADIMNEWAERYRNVPDGEPFVSEIGRRLFALALEEGPEIPQMVFDDMVETAEEDYKAACRLIDQKDYEKAAAKLGVLTEVIASYPLSDDAVWKDFTSYLDALVFQDFFSEVIGDREVRRHPMHPGPILFTYGSLLIEMEDAEEALRPLGMLADLDPVCVKYLFELGEAYKRTGRIKEAFDNALWAASCAANRSDLARCYRDMAYCLSEAENYEDSAMLYMLSLHFQSSRHAESEIAWIRQKSGVSPEKYDLETIRQRCAEVGIPVGISDVVKRNIEFLKTIDQIENDGDGSDN